MILAGFANPVVEAQRCFRAVLDAMARPGRVHSIAGDLRAPPPLHPATAAVLLTLADLETPVWLDAASTEAGDWIAFHCGAPIVRHQSDCVFAVALSLPDLSEFPGGTHEAPETSATLILQVPSIGTGAPYRLEGPGLQQPGLIRVKGLPEDFPARWQRNHTRFPLGLDLVLCAGSEMAALPRTVSVSEG